MSNKKRALVLSGGGNRGAFELGILKHLICDKGHRYDTVIGVSVGALNSSFIAKYNKKDQEKAIFDLENLWRNIEKKDVYNAWYNSYIMSTILSISGMKPSILDSKPLKKLIEENSIDLYNTDVELMVGVTELISGKFIVINGKNENIKDFILASGSIPVVFPPVEINNIQYVDGGIRNNTPLKTILESGEYDTVDVIILVPKEDEFKIKSKKLNTIYNILFQTIEILAHKVLYSEVNVINSKFMFDGIQEICVNSGVKLNIYAPEKSLLSAKNAHTVLNFDKNLINKFIELGYYDAKKQAK